MSVEQSFPISGWIIPGLLTIESAIGFVGAVVKIVPFFFGADIYLAIMDRDISLDSHQGLRRRVRTRSYQPKAK